MDPRMKNLANILVNYSTEVKQGDWVVIIGRPISEPLMNEISKAVLQAGGYPEVFIRSEVCGNTKMKYANKEQLQFVSPVLKSVYSKADVIISLAGTENTRSANNIDPENNKISNIAHRELNETFFKRMGSGETRWAITNFPCNAFAQDAEMSLEEYEDFHYSATYADQSDPIAMWKKVHDDQQKYIDWLKGKEQITVKGPNADLKLSIKGRGFLNGDGKSNMPCGELFTSPIEDSANGWVYFNYPALHDGREILGIRLEFENGKVVKASAEKNEEYLLKILDSDKGARYLGEFAIGTNYGIKKISRDLLYDEKIGGSFHLAVGHGFPEIGSKNESSIHWDMISDARTDTEIAADGEVFYKDGKFLI